MPRTVLLVVLGLLLVAGALIALDVVPLGFEGSESDGTDGGADLMGADAGDGDGATLQGRADAAKKHAAAQPADPIVVVPDIPAEVRGSAKNGGVIRGRVVREKGGLPLAGVTVTLGWADSLVTYLRASPNGRFDLLTARTGPDGRFAFLEVTPAKGYVVRARHTDFAVTSTDDDLDLIGQSSIDVGDLKLGAGAALTGRVVDQGGTPLPNVRVSITWRISNPVGVILADPEMAPEIEREVTTGKDGRFTANKLDPQPKTLIAVAPSGASQVVRSVSLEDGELKSIDDIRMPGGGVLAGTVVWADGKPVTDARVFAAPSMQAAVRTVDVDAKGAFRLTWLPDSGLSDYVIGVLVPGLPINLNMGYSVGQEDVRIEFPLPGAIKGVVVSDKSGEPVPRFAIRMDDVNPGENFQLNFVMEQVKRGLGPTPFEASDGTFVLPRVAAGTYRLTVSAPGWPTVVHDSLEVVAGETAEVKIEVPAGHVGRGMVLSTKGEPVKGARVFVVRGVHATSAGPGLQRYVYERKPDAVTRADGRFVLPPQTPGTYALIATHKAFLPGLLRSVDLKLADAEGLEIRLPPSGSVRGSLRDEAGRPAKGEKVFLLYPSGVVRTTDVAEDGTFALSGMPVGRCLVRWLGLHEMSLYRRFNQARDEAAREKAYDDMRGGDLQHTITSGGTIKVSLRIPPRTLVTGRYLLAGNPPPENRRNFYVTTEGGGHYVGIAVKADGSYETRLMPGKYLVYGPTSTGSYASRPIEVPDAATHSLDIEMD